MTVKELCEKTGFKVVCLPEPEREVSGCYCGDLLSWVMGRASSGQVWITIMSNINIVAVATLCDTAVIILSENVALEENVVNTAEQRGVNIVSAPMPTFEAAKAIADLV